ncbi:Hpt domain-containing protein [Planktotalea arctica]|uniref:Hpt domain-containing protein n=1 Tax=Planktotalea arctica TaxID=1481893 RepID=UPI000A16DE47|nr:Hpt domain-containing protein [Planktotalea arctica]
MINWARATELRDEIGAEDFEEVVDLFLSEVEERLETLSKDKSIDAIEEDLHFLKGSALNLGFEGLAKLCHLGEKRAASGEPVEELDQVVGVYEASKTAFLSKLAESAAA